MDGPATLVAWDTRMKTPSKTGSPDDFQTPAVALNPLIPWLLHRWKIWEPACGQGNIVRALTAEGFKVTGTDILFGDDFLTMTPPDFDCIITNPPYRTKPKLKFMTRCYELGKPWAMLMPLTTFETPARQALMDHYGIQVIFFDKRVKFHRANWTEGPGIGWFATAWFTWGLRLPRDMIFEHLEASDG